MNFSNLVNQARKKLHKSNSPRYKHFTFIVTNSGYIASYGINNIKKTHPLAKKYGHRFFSTHSEINAIAKFPYTLRNLKNYSIINIRLDRYGCLKLAKPCIHCQALLHTLQIKKIIYSTNNGFKKLDLEI